MRAKRFGVGLEFRVLFSTVLLAATIDQLVPGAAYLALSVPVAGNAKLHAEVTHRSGGTGTYLFSAGRGSSRTPRSSRSTSCPATP